MSYKKMLPLVLAALLLWTVPASAAPETTLKVAVGDPEDSEMGVVGHAFKKYVEEKTGGKVEVQCFYGGSLGDESEAFRNVQKLSLIHIFILWGQVYDRMERTVDAVSDLADTLEEVALKYV